MTGQQMPKPPTLTVTWSGPPNTPNPYSSIVVNWRAKCEDCTCPTWHEQGTPAVCLPCASLRAYAALPWWRRWASRKPRP